MNELPAEFQRFILFFSVISCPFFWEGLIEATSVPCVRFFGLLPERFYLLFLSNMFDKPTRFVNAPIIEGSPLVIECQLIEIVRGTNFSTALAKIVNVAADASVLAQNERVDSLKTGRILYDPFGTGYVNLGQRVGTAWGEGKKFM